ncbi:MAG: SDR family NAD(P)-dependent oxidoreductase [Actinobacteria bacterium]|nr:SDR family NAD(P)-dependent oxidoreductase [Actinomycetota bacterium]
MELNGKVAIVTGASRGVGAATAVALAAAGMRVACAARATDETPLPLPGTIDETVRKVTDAGGEAISVPTNLAVIDEIERMVSTTLDRFGRVDALINNAAITFPGDLDLPVKRHDLIFAVNTRAPLVAIQSVTPAMKEQGEGAIVNVSSLAGLNYFPSLMAYGMSKVALEHLTVSAAVQLAPFNIAVNTFRIDVPVASEGFLANAPEFDHSDWEPSEVAAEGILWMLQQPSSYTGRNESMARLRADHGIMATRVSREHTPMGGINTENPMPYPGTQH